MIQVGNYIHNMATFFSGLVIGLINCWQIALITLATGPFIVAAGGISNIFLHRLAENIQDAYAEAASIAEQVVLLFEFQFCFTLNPVVSSFSIVSCLHKADVEMNLGCILLLFYIKFQMGTSHLFNTTLSLYA